MLLEVLQKCQEDSKWELKNLKHTRFLLDKLIITKNRHWCKIERCDAVRWVLHSLLAKWLSCRGVATNYTARTSITDDTPFFERATHKYCLMALINISLVLKTGPALCRIASNNCSDRILLRSSWDLKIVGRIYQRHTKTKNQFLWCIKYELRQDLCYDYTSVCATFALWRCIKIKNQITAIKPNQTSITASISMELTTVKHCRKSCTATSHRLSVHQP